GVAVSSASNIRLVHSGKSLFVRIYEDVLLGVGVAYKVVQAATFVCWCVKLLDGDAALVFDDSIDAPIDVAHAKNDAVAEFVLEPGNILVRVFHARPGSERFTAAEANVHGVADAARGRIEKGGRARLEHVGVIRISARIRLDAGSSAWRPRWTTGRRGSGLPVRAKHI